MPHAGPSLFPVSISISSGHSLIRLIMCSAITSTSQASKKPSQISARLKALHGTSSTNVLLTLADYGRRSQKYEERPLGNARLNFEEITTVLSQIKAWQAVTLQKLNK